MHHSGTKSKLKKTPQENKTCVTVIVIAPFARILHSCKITKKSTFKVLTSYLSFYFLLLFVNINTQVRLQRTQTLMDPT